MVEYYLPDIDVLISSDSYVVDITNDDGMKYSEAFSDVLNPFMEGVSLDESKHYLYKVIHFLAGWAGIYKLLGYSELDDKDDIVGESMPRPRLLNPTSWNAALSQQHTSAEKLGFIHEQFDSAVDIMNDDRGFGTRDIENPSDMRFDNVQSRPSFPVSSRDVNGE